MNTLSWLASNLDLSSQAAIPLLVGMLLAFGFIRIINGSNPVQWWHFFATYNPQTHSERGDVNSLGMVAGIAASMFTIMWTTYSAGPRGINPWILAICLIYLGGVKMFAAWLRSLADRRFSNPALDVTLPSAQREVTDAHTERVTTQEEHHDDRG